MLFSSLMFVESAKVCVNLLPRIRRMDDSVTRDENYIMDKWMVGHQDLCILRVKYEHLCATIKCLMEAWPQAKEEIDDKAISSIPANEKGIHEIEEFGQLESLLSRAQTVCIPKTQVKKKTSEQSMSDKDMEKKDPSKTNRKLDSNIVKAKSKSASKARRTNATAKTTTLTGSSAKLDLHESESDELFMLKKNGNKLFMPPKYNKLRKKIQGYGDASIDEPLVTSRTVASHFVKRLQPKRTDSSADEMEMILLKHAIQQTHVIKFELEQLLSQDLKSLERKSWQDILGLQAKLNHLRSKYLLIEHSVSRYHHPYHSDPTDSSRSEQGITTELETGASREQGQVQFNQQPVVCGATADCPLAFTSLDEWVSVSKLDNLLKYKQLELDFLRDVEESVLPVICQSTSDSAPTPESTQEVIAMIRALHLTFGLPSRPVYIDATQMIN